MMTIPRLILLDHQRIAIEKLRTGAVLCGGVGSGKSLTSLAYFWIKECGGNLDEFSLRVSGTPKDLYIITTAAKRNTLDWEKEASKFLITNKRDISINGILLTVDSWNNIHKYIKVENSFFIFDEQRLVGSGAWVKSFLKITKKNNWILLSATPGDNWMDYIAVFIANGFYKNRTEFITEHVVYNSFTKFPKVDRFVGQNKLLRLKKEILVDMPYAKPTKNHSFYLTANFDEDKFCQIKEKRWNPFTNKPIKDISEYCFAMRHLVNIDPSRLEIVKDLIFKHQKLIVFYNFDYELDILLSLKENYVVAQYNGHKHEKIPIADSWVYLVQYLAGAEGWNCIETNAILFYSMNYSYRITTQAAGRIDRLNTTFTDLYYYTITSNSFIDVIILKTLKEKKSFNENTLKF